MRIASSNRRRSLQFAITPLIDVVFLLIIFFLVSTHFVQSETQSAVNLPESTEFDQLEEAKPHRLVITISSEGEYSVNSRPVDWAELEAMILTREEKTDQSDSREIRIRTDQASTYRFVKPILVACAKAKLSKISFSVIPVEQ